MVKGWFVIAFALAFVAWTLDYSLSPPVATSLIAAPVAQAQVLQLGSGVEGHGHPVHEPFGDTLDYDHDHPRSNQGMRGDGPHPAEAFRPVETTTVSQMALKLSCVDGTSPITRKPVKLCWDPALTQCEKSSDEDGVRCVSLCRQLRAFIGEFFSDGQYYWYGVRTQEKLLSDY